MDKHLPVEVSEIICHYAEGLHRIYGTKLVRVVLFGSYARGDYTDSSDIDVLVVADAEGLELARLRKEMVHLTFETNLTNDVEIEPVLMKYADYRRWEMVHPLLEAVRRDGVKLYEAA